MNWQPVIFNKKIDNDISSLEGIEKKKQIWRKYDNIKIQMKDLVLSRNPHWEKEGINEENLNNDIRDLTKGDLNEYGVWVYFPWSGILSHILPEDEFHELRLNRNQNKITKTEQEHLSQSAVGIVGLSVGNAVAISLAIDGVGGHLKLADFDQLDLSNMNRIRASIGDIGIPKTVLCARQIYEFNPFAKLEIFEKGISEENIDEFLAGQHPLDIVIDECDDVRLKFLIREQARNHRIPVIMETSDRGMLDVERFDHEPDRPLFHGILGNISFSNIPKKLTTEEKVPYVAPIIGTETLSDRLAASMLEIGERISTWPQLGSDVLLGGASVCIAVRKILLGDQLLSGRYFIDVDSHLQKRPDPLPKNAESDEIDNVVIPNDIELKEQPKQPDDFMKFLVAQAILAPSGGNSQPWKFYIENDFISVFHDRKRSKNIIDPDSCGAYIGLGAAIENIRIAAEAHNYGVDINYLPEPAEHLRKFVVLVGEVVATLQIKKGCASSYSQSLKLYPYISRRMTDRKTYGHIPLKIEQRSILHSIATELDFSLQLLECEAKMAKVSEIVGQSDRLRFLSRKTHEELMSEIRWTTREAVETGDGIDVQSLGLTPSQLTGLRLIRRPKVARLLKHQSGGSGLIELSEKAIKNSSAVGLISIASNQKAAFLTAGQAIQLFWIKCSQLGLSIHPNTGFIYLFNSESNFLKNELGALKKEFFEVFEYHEGLNPLLLFRLSIGENLQPTAQRRPLPKVILSDGT